LTHVPGPPPALSTLDYAAAFGEVALLGDAAIPADDKAATYQFWSLPAGSAQPAGAWLEIALVADARRLSLVDGVRLAALLTMAMADTTVATVATKSGDHSAQTGCRRARGTDRWTCIARDAH
jgi:hypothetical protein